VWYQSYCFPNGAAAISLATLYANQTGTGFSQSVAANFPGPFFQIIFTADVMAFERANFYP
jgi:hypothetical protein